jgi:hypothetical protein
MAAPRSTVRSFIPAKFEWATRRISLSTDH